MNDSSMTPTIAPLPAATWAPMSAATAGDDGVGAAIAERDGPFGDYSQAPADEQPDPENVIEP